jgi:hypothetical protein
MSFIWREYERLMVSKKLVKQAKEEPEIIDPSAKQTVVLPLTYDYRHKTKEELERNLKRHKEYQKQDEEWRDEFKNRLSEKDLPDFERDNAEFEINIYERVLQMRSEMIQALEEELKNR